MIYIPNQDKIESIARRIASYLFIVAVFSMLCSFIALCVQWGNRWWFHFEYINWSFIDWWVFISVFVFIGTLFLFLSPYIVKQLSVWLDYRINKMIAKTKVYEKKLTVKIEAEKQKYFIPNNDTIAKIVNT